MYIAGALLSHRIRLFMVSSIKNNQIQGCFKLLRFGASLRTFSITMAYCCCNDNFMKFNLHYKSGLIIFGI